MKIAFVTNICAHYRVKTFESLSKYHDLTFFFFSAGDEWYWQQNHGIRTGNFKYQYLPGFRIGRTRITPILPWLLFRGNYDLYIKCINGRFALPVTFLVARLRRKPIILWTGIWTRIQTKAHRLFFPLTRYIYRHADAIVVYGEHVKQYLVSEGALRKRIFIASHAVDNVDYQRNVSEENREALRQQLGINQKQKVILFLGRLEKIKGLPFLVEAFAKLNRADAVLVFAGTGSEEEKLKLLVREKGIELNVRFAGYVSPEQAVTYYAIGWVLVLCSITLPEGKELWGLVINEAFNQGLPVIVSTAVGAAAGGLVQDQINGMIVPERDSNALANTLTRILDDINLRDYMSRNALMTIEKWDNQRMVMGFLEAIQYVGSFE